MASDMKKCVNTLTQGFDPWTPDILALMLRDLTTAPNNFQIETDKKVMIVN